MKKVERIMQLKRIVEESRWTIKNSYNDYKVEAAWDSLDIALDSLDLLEEELTEDELHELELLELDLKMSEGN